MRLFRQTIAEYTCKQRCGYHRSVVCATLSPFDLIAAGVATIPLWLVSLLNPWNFPWYYLFGILSGELLLIFGAGFLSSVLVLPFIESADASCKQCRSPMFLAGRHFDPLGSSKPHWSDIVILIVFVGLNVAVWIVFTCG